MTRFLRLKRVRILRGDGGENAPLTFVFVLFFVGVLAGSLFGSLLSGRSELTLAGYISSNISARSIFDSIYSVLFFIGLGALFSTSYLGLFLIPALVVVKAYTFSHTVAALCLSFGMPGIVTALFAVGIPGLITLPAFLLCCYKGILVSRQLYSLHFLASPYTKNRMTSLPVAIFILSAVLLAILYDYFVLPLLLSRFI